MFVPYFSCYLVFLPSQFITFFIWSFIRWLCPSKVSVRWKNSAYHACSETNRRDAPTLNTSSSSRMSSLLAELLAGSTTTFCTVPRSVRERTRRCYKPCFERVRKALRHKMTGLDFKILFLHHLNIALSINYATLWIKYILGWKETSWDLAMWD